MGAILRTSTFSTLLLTSLAFVPLAAAEETCIPQPVGPVIVYVCGDENGLSRVKICDTALCDNNSIILTCAHSETYGCSQAINTPGNSFVSFTSCREQAPFPGEESLECVLLAPEVNQVLLIKPHIVLYFGSSGLEGFCVGEFTTVGDQCLAFYPPSFGTGLCILLYGLIAEPEHCVIVT